MKISSINNPNFRALSLRAATVGLSDCRNDESEKEKMENIILN